MYEPDSNLPPQQQEERRRTFWSLYLLDRLVSCGKHRPLAINDSSCTLRLPCDEEDWRSGRQTHSPYLDDVWERQSPDIKLSPNALIVAAAKCLTRCTQYMLQGNQTRFRDQLWHPKSDIASISSDILFLETFLPLSESMSELFYQECTTNGVIDPQVAGPRIFGRMLLCTCHCVLNHPFLLYTKYRGKNTLSVSFLTRAFDTGREFAIRLTNIVRESREVGFAFHTSFGGYCIALAGTIHALFIKAKDEDMRNQSQKNLDISLEHLRIISGFWRNIGPMASLSSQLDLAFIYSRS